MRRWFIILALVFATVARGAGEWEIARPGTPYVFPRDHQSHEGFKTEWWYFTGNLRAADGRQFGYQITFFRHGVRPPNERAGETSRFIVHDLKFAHFALSELSAKRFHFTQKLTRGAFGEAGNGAEKLAWIDDWELRLLQSGEFELKARDGERTIALRLATTKPWTIHGENGISQKATGEGRASHYYSGTRMQTTGRISIAGKDVPVSGESWFDHEWATNQLTAEQVGWNWFSMQLDDGSELMIYQMRTRDGGADPNSSGTIIGPDGATEHLKREDYELIPRDYWTSKKTGGRYPIAWTLRIPKRKLEVEISTPLADQELILKPVVYWEGAIDVRGRRGGMPLTGRGYMELTGYAGALVGLSQ